MNIQGGDHGDLCACCNPLAPYKCDLILHASMVQECWLGEDWAQGWLVCKGGEARCTTCPRTLENKSDTLKKHSQVKTHLAAMARVAAAATEVPEVATAVANGVRALLEKATWREDKKKLLQVTCGKGRAAK